MNQFRRTVAGELKLLGLKLGQPRLFVKNTQQAEKLLDNPFQDVHDSRIDSGNTLGRFMQL